MKILNSYMFRHRGAKLRESTWTNTFEESLMLHRAFRRVIELA